MPDKEKWFAFPLHFKTAEDRDAFKNYVHGIKEGRGIPIYKTASEMMELHKEKYQKKR